MKCQYLEKVEDTKKKIYKLLDSAVYVTPKMVESPLVSMNFDLSLLIQEYIYLVM